MTTQTAVFITMRFAALHRWKDSPTTISYLRNYHRHEFHVRLEKLVSHNNRDIEFIRLKHEVTKYVRDTLEGNAFDLSCEEIAQNLLEAFDASLVEVSEDGENGSVVRRTKENQ